MATSKPVPLKTCLLSSAGMSVLALGLCCAAGEARAQTCPPPAANGQVAVSGADNSCTLPAGAYATTADSVPVVTAQSAAVVTLTGATTLQSGGAGAHGLAVAGPGSRIGASAAVTINAAGYGAHAEDGAIIALSAGSIRSRLSALNVLSGATINTTNVAMTATGANAGGVFVESGTVNLIGGSVTTTTGSQSNGLLTRNAASRITADGVTLNTSGDGINAVFGSHVGFANGRITSAAVGVSVGAGARSELTATTVLVTGADTAGLRASDSGSSITATNLAITTRAANSHGAWAQAGGRIEIDPTTIITSGTGAYGLLSDGAGSIVTSSGDTIYTGVLTNAAGVPIRANGAVATSPAQYVTSGAAGAHGAYALSGGEIWINVDPSDGAATGGSGLIRTLGTGSDGMSRKHSGDTIPNFLITA